MLTPAFAEPCLGERCSYLSGADNGLLDFELGFAFTSRRIVGFVFRRGLRASFRKWPSYSLQMIKALR